MAATLIVSGGAQADVDPGPVVTSGYNTTGADVIVVFCAVETTFNQNNTLTDPPYNNTWLTAGSFVNSALGQCGIQAYYCLSPTVGAGHTFSLAGRRPCVMFEAWASGGTPSFIGTDGAAATSSSTVTINNYGNISGSLLIGGLNSGTTAKTFSSVNAGFTLDQALTGAVFGSGDAYLISISTPTTVTFTISGLDSGLVLDLVEIAISGGGGTTYEGAVEFDVTAALARTITLDMSPALSMAASTAFSDSPGNVINASRSLATSVASAFSNTQDSVGSISLSALLAIARSNTLDAQASATLATIVAFATTGGNVFDSSVQVDILAAAVFSTFRGTAAAITASTIAACSSASSLDAVGSITASAINAINNSVDAALVALQSIGVHPQIQLAAGFDLFSSLTLLVSALLSTAGSFPGNDPLLISLVAERLREAGLTGSTLSTVDVDDETLRSGQ